MSHRNARDPLIGPLGGWELLRLARRGQVTRARLLVLYLLLIAFVLTPVLWFPHTDPVQLFVGTVQTLPPAQAAAFANRFALVMLQAILLAVAAMTPGYAAAAVAEEKERRTLQLLLTTPLADREIVLGKAAGRLGFVLAAAAAGLPVLAAATLFGGVSIPFLLAGCGLIASTAALTTAVGLHAACAAPDLRGALVRAYGVTAVAVGGAFVPPLVLVTPFAALVWLEDSPGQGVRLALVGLAYPAAQLVAATWFLAAAVRRVRDGEDAPAPAPMGAAPAADPDTPPGAAPPSHTPAGSDPRSEWSAAPSRAAGAAWWAPDLPPVDESDPLLWKERHVTGRKAGPGSGDAGRVAVWGLGAVAVLLMVAGGATLLARSWPPRPHEDDGGGRLLMTGGTVAAGVFLVPVAVGLAAAVARERHLKTLDALLALPVARRVVLRTKVRAVLERGWWWEPAAVLAAGVSFGADGGWALGLAAAGFVLGGAGLVVGLGAWLTVRCPTEVRALRFLVPAVVVAVGVPVMAWNQTDWVRPGDSVAPLAAGAAAAAVAGAVLWRRAVRELDRVG